MIPSSKVAASISQSAHLWAVSYDDLASAERARHELTRLGGPHQYLILLDTAVVVRDADGSFSLDKKPFAIVSNVLGCTMLGFLAGLVVAAPLTGAAIGAAFGSSGSAVARRIGIIDNHFIQEVNANMKPATVRPVRTGRWRR